MSGGSRYEEGGRRNIRGHVRWGREGVLEREVKEKIDEMKKAMNIRK